MYGSCEERNPCYETIRTSLCQYFEIDGILSMAIRLLGSIVEHVESLGAHIDALLSSGG